MVAKGDARIGHSFTIGSWAASVHRLYACATLLPVPGLSAHGDVFEGGPWDRRMLEACALTASWGSLSPIAEGQRHRHHGPRAPPARRPQGPEGRGFGSEVDRAWLDSLGATAVPLEHRREDILPAARSGALDNVVVTWRNFQQATLDSRTSSTSA